MTLDAIALKHGTDKSSAVHNYTRYYERYFEPLRDQAIKLLEIGVAEGYSLKTWEEYFPKGNIVGMDNKDCSLAGGGRISILQGNQGNKKHLKQITGMCNNFDIIIDDGSHINKHMVMTFETLFPTLKPGGLYIIEDLHTCYWGHGFGRPTLPKRLKQLIDEVNASGKSGLGDRKKEQEVGGYDRRRGKMSWWEQNVEYMHIYRSIVFIKRYD